MIRKNDFKAWAAVMTLLLTFAVTTAKAADGDQWEALGVMTNNDGEAFCLFEVISESDATVRFVSRSDGSCTLQSLGSSDRFWMYNTVSHNGKTYAITEVGENAFYAMTGLQEVSVMSANIKNINQNAFAECTNLTAVNLPSGLEKIDNYAFYGCTKLACTTYNGNDNDGVVFPASLKRIGLGAFFKCKNIKSIKLNEGLLDMYSEAFHGCESLTSATLPSSLTFIGSAPFNECTQLQNIYKDDNGMYYAKDGVLYRRVDTEYGTQVHLMQFPGGRTGTYDIADEVNVVDNWAFAYSNIYSVFIPMTVSSIGNYAFAYAPQLGAVYVEWTSELPTLGATPFVTDTGKKVYQLCIPNKASGMSEADILNLYKGTELANAFEHVYLYTPVAVEGLRVGGEQMLRTTCTNMTSGNGITKGSVNYDVSTKTLTLYNATIETSGNEEYGIENYGLDGLTIRLNGTNNVNTYAAGMLLKGKNTIEGPGKLILDSYYEEGILVDHGSLYIINTDLDLGSRGGALSGNTWANIYVDNSRLYLRPTGASGVATVNNITGFQLSNCHFSSPIFCSFSEDHEAVVNYMGNPCYSYVVVTPGEAYDLYLGTQVTAENKDNISYYGLQKGHASYDPNKNVLTLDNVRVLDNAGVLLSRVDGLTVNLIGQNYLNSSEDCIWLLNNTKFTGSGTLEASSDYGSAMKLDGEWVFVDIDNTNMNLHGVSGAIWGSDDDYQQVSITNSNVTLASDGGNYRVVDMVRGLYLYDAEFVHDYFYFDEGEHTLCDQRYYGDPVYQDVVEIVATGVFTGIEDASDATVEQSNSPIYDLQGRRITGHPQPGILIQQGRKYVVR